MYTKNLESGTPVEVVTKKGIKTYIKMPCLKKSRQKILNDLMSKYNECDLRFMYFRSNVNPNIIITAVSNWNRDKGTVTVGFSFCSEKERFSRREGKIACFEHMNEIDHPFVSTVPWLDDGLLSTFLAFNRIAKPIKLSCAKFDSLYFNNICNNMIG